MKMPSVLFYSNVSPKAPSAILFKLKSISFSLFLLLPLEKKNGDDNANDEDHSQDWTDHPEETLFLVHDWLRIHVGGGDWFGIRAGGVHCLEDEVGWRERGGGVSSHALVGQTGESFSGRTVSEFDSRSLRGRAAPARRRRTPDRSATADCGSPRSFGRHRA